MPADPYEVLGLGHGASDAEVRDAYLRLAKRHHPDKNPGDKASEWIFKQVQRAYETLRDANDVRSAGQERAPRAQEDDARTWRDQADTQRERAEHARQREQQAEEAERERYEQWERQQAEYARRRWERTRAKYAAREEGETASVCDACGSVVRWWTRLPLIIRLSAAWVLWALGLMPGTCFWAVLGLSVLLPLLEILGVSLTKAVIVGIFFAALGVMFGLALLLLREDRPKVCLHCGRVSLD